MQAVTGMYNAFDCMSWVLLPQMLNVQAREVSMALQRQSSLQLGMMTSQTALRRPLRAAAVQRAHHRLQHLTSRRQRRLACPSGLYRSLAVEPMWQTDLRTVIAWLLKLWRRPDRLLQRGGWSLQHAQQIASGPRRGSQPLLVTLRIHQQAQAMDMSSARLLICQPSITQLWRRGATWEDTRSVHSSFMSL